MPLHSTSTPRATGNEPPPELGPASHSSTVHRAWPCTDLWLDRGQRGHPAQDPHSAASGKALAWATEGPHKHRAQRKRPDAEASGTGGGRARSEVGQAVRSRRTLCNESGGHPDLCWWDVPWDVQAEVGERRWPVAQDSPARKQARPQLIAWGGVGATVKGALALRGSVAPRGGSPLRLSRSHSDLRTRCLVWRPCGGVWGLCPPSCLPPAPPVPHRAHGQLPWGSQPPGHQEPARREGGTGRHHRRQPGPQPPARGVLIGDPFIWGPERQGWLAWQGRPPTPYLSAQ